MKRAIYIRVSTENQPKEGYSLEVQREYLESFAEYVFLNRSLILNVVDK